MKSWYKKSESSPQKLEMIGSEIPRKSGLTKKVRSLESYNKNTKKTPYQGRLFFISNQKFDFIFFLIKIYFHMQQLKMKI